MTFAVRQGSRQTLMVSEAANFADCCGPCRCWSVAVWPADEVSSCEQRFRVERPRSFCATLVWLPVIASMVIVTGMCLTHFSWCWATVGVRCVFV